MDCSLSVTCQREVCSQVTRRLQSMSYSGMKFVDKLHADYNPCLTPVRFVDKLNADYNLTSYRSKTWIVVCV
jgi:hypothetical protein